MAAEDHTRVPDILLERYLAGDLSPEQRRRLEADLQSSDQLRSRLEELQHEKAAFLAADPPAQFAHRLATRLEIEQEEAAARPGRRRWWAWILAPATAAAATAAVTVLYVQTARQPSLDAEAVGQSGWQQAPAAKMEGQPAASAPVGSGRTSQTRGSEGRKDLGAGREAEYGFEPMKVNRGVSRRGRAGPKLSAADGLMAAEAPAPKPPSVRPPPEPQPDRELAPMADAAADAPADAVAEEAAAMESAGDTGAAAPAADPAPARAPSRARKKPKSKKGAAGGGSAKTMDTLFDKPGKAGRGLSTSDILEGVKKNAANLKPCIKAAASKGELPSGNYKLTLSWTIQADGSVRSGRLTGPPAVMTTSLPRCFRKAMRSWRWPPSAQATPVKGYPLPFKL